MKLLEAEIFNFGKLHDEKISFDEHLNPILHENGWGKTTLTVFIKSMLYGMETSTKRDLRENEKKKYTPWQGGTYGGSLTFEHNGKNYRVSRTFGAKEADDTFELIDLETNQESADFSANLGSEIFGVSRDTYARSAYVTLDAVPENTTDVSAKLNNLVEDSGDVSNFDDACKKLEERATGIKAKRGGGGIISKIEAKIIEDRNTLEDIKAKLLQNEEISKQVAAEKEHITGVKQNQELVTRQLSDWARYVKKETYTQLTKDAEATKAAQSDVESFFNGNVPSRETVAGIDSLCASFQTVDSNIKTQSATQAQKDQYRQLSDSFAGDIPTREKINECIQEDSDYKEFKQVSGAMKLSPAEAEEYDRLNVRFQGADISEDAIKNCMEQVQNVQNRKAELTAVSAEGTACESRLQLEKQKKPENKARKLLFILGAIAAVIGVVLIVLKLTIPSIAGFVLGAGCIVAGALSKGKAADTSALEAELNSIRDRAAALEAAITAAENQYKSFIARYAPGEASELVALTTISTDFGNYSRLREKQHKYESWLSTQKKPEDYENAIKAFMKRYCKTDDISSVPSDIQILNDKLNTFEELKKLINSDSSNSESFNELKDKLDSVLADYKTDKTKSYPDQVQELHNSITKLENCRNNVAAAEKNLKDFIDNLEGDVSSLEAVQKPEKSETDLETEQIGYSNDIEAKNKIIATYEKQISDNLTVTDREGEVENEIDELTQQKEDKEREYKVLDKTLKLLKLAKENLDRNYSRGMIDGFNKYISMLGTDLNLVIDNNLNVSVDEMGKMRERGYLSEGYKDMVNFCARMALVDALYTDEKPPVILDDPFVNLDDAKVPKALKLVNKLSEDRQVIYFACHESRKL